MSCVMLTDVNECVNNNNGQCEHNCFNNIGSYICTCDPGYTLANNGFSCEGILHYIKPYIVVQLLYLCKILSIIIYMFLNILFH